MVPGSRITARAVSLRSQIPALPLAAGVFVGQMVVWFSSLWWCGALLIGCGVAVVFIPRVSRCAIVGISLGLSTGIVNTKLHPAEWRAGDAQVLIRIEERPTRRVPGEVTFVGKEVLGGGGRALRCRAIEVPWRNASGLERGDVVWVRGAITPISRPINPFSWDGWLWRQGVSGEMRALFVSRPVSHEESHIEGIRRRIRSGVSYLTGDGRGGALFLSMALGERDVLSSNVENAFKAVGMSHLLVVSGYQVSLVFGVIFAAFTQVRRVFGAHVYVQTVATWCALLSCSGYVVLVGAEMSSVRALIAAACLCVALVIDRSHRFAQRWATAALLMEVIYPWALCEVGVILTFAALAGIGLGSALGERRVVVSSLWVTVCVWLLTSTVTLVWNGSISLMGLALNLLLAAPWSIWNCAIGGLALGFAAIPSGFAALPLQGVAWVNEVVTLAIMNCAGIGAEQKPLDGLTRWAVCAALICGCVYVSRRVDQTSYGRSVRSMVTRRYTHS